jgi:hypothetical protein
VYYTHALYLFTRMTFVGQISAHLPQFVHFSGSIPASLRSIVIAPHSQAFSQRLQPMQPALQTFRTNAPVSVEEQPTYTSLAAGTI